MSVSKHLAIALEAVGIVVVSGGIIIEWITRAHFGFVIITSGSVLVALGGLVWSKLIKK